MKPVPPSGNTILPGRENASLDEAVIQAYRNAEYRIHATPPFSLKVDTRSDELRALYASTGTRSAAFVTAFNPLGQVLDTAENMHRLDILESRIDWTGLIRLPAEGIDPAGSWLREKGFLVLGIELEEAQELGREFRQNAVLWCDETGWVKLVVLV